MTTARIASERESEGKKAGRGFLISRLEKLSWFCLTNLITLMLSMWKWIGQFLIFLRYWGWRGALDWLKLDWGSYIITIAETAWKINWSLDLFCEFLSPRPCMEYCCHVWAVAPGCYFEMLDKLQKRICRTVGPSLPASLEPLAHRRSVASLSLYIGTFVDIHLNWLNWFHVLILEAGLLVILLDSMIFLSAFQDVARMSMSAVSFLSQIDSEIICSYNTFLWSMI